MLNRLFPEKGLLNKITLSKHFLPIFNITEISLLTRIYYNINVHKSKQKKTENISVVLYVPETY